MCQPVPGKDDLTTARRPVSAPKENERGKRLKFLASADNRRTSPSARGRVTRTQVRLRRSNRGTAERERRAGWRLGSAGFARGAHERSRSAHQPPRRRPDRDAPALRRHERHHLPRHRELLPDRAPGGAPHPGTRRGQRSPPTSSSKATTTSLAIHPKLRRRRRQHQPRHALTARPQ